MRRKGTRSRYARGVWLVALMSLVLALAACGGQPAAKDAGKAAAPAPAPAPAAKAPTAPAATPAPAPAKFPTKPVRLVVTHEAGGTTDVVGRLVVSYAEKPLGQPIVVENMPGAGGQVATESVYKATPDGYTLLIAQDPGFSMRFFMGNAKYEPLKFEHVYNILGHDFNAIAVEANSPIKDLKDLVNVSKTKELKVAMGGIGSNSHLAALVVKAKTGANIRPIPYEGGFGPIRQSVLSKETDFGMGGLLGWMELYGQKKVRILGILGGQRDSRAPEVPTLKEMGYPEAVLEQFMGIMAPPGTPKVVVDTLAAAFEKATKEPQFLDAAKKANMTLALFGPAEFRAFHKEIYDLVGQFKDILQAPTKK